MKAYLRKRLAGFWLRVAAFGFARQQPVCPEVQPGDVERLLEELAAMNAVLARAARI